MLSNSHLSIAALASTRATPLRILLASSKCLGDSHDIPLKAQKERFECVLEHLQSTLDTHRRFRAFALEQLVVWFATSGDEWCRPGSFKNCLHNYVLSAHQLRVCAPCSWTHGSSTHVTPLTAQLSVQLVQAEADECTQVTGMCEILSGRVHEKKMVMH